MTFRKITFDDGSVFSTNGVKSSWKVEIGGLMYGDTIEGEVKNPEEWVKKNKESVKKQIRKMSEKYGKDKVEAYYFGREEDFQA